MTVFDGEPREVGDPIWDHTELPQSAPDGPLPVQGSLAPSSVEATYGIDLLGVGMMRVLLNSLSRQATELAWTEHRLGWVDHAFVVTGTPENLGFISNALEAWYMNRQI